MCTTGVGDPIPGPPWVKVLSVLELEGMDKLGTNPGRVSQLRLTWLVR
jgi:hypothetical protein